MQSFERDGQVQLCYNGEAHRRVLALPASDSQKALAALALTRHECVAPGLTPVERFNLDNWRAEVLDRVETGKLPEVLKNRLHLRKAGVWASLAYQRARRPELGQPAVQAGRQPRHRQNWPPSTRANWRKAMLPLTATRRSALAPRAGPPNRPGRSAPQDAGKSQSCRCALSLPASRAKPACICSTPSMI